MIWQKDDFTISSEKTDVDIGLLHDMLGRSYWAKNRTRKEVETSVENCLCFSLLKDGRMIGFVRVLTDKMAYAVILDMIIHEDFRRRGLGQWMMQCLIAHPDLAPLRQVLWTGDADDFYRKSEFEFMSGLKFMARNWKM